MMQCDTFRIIIWNGQPSIWLTINLNDIGNPLCYIVAGVRIPLKVSSVMRKKIRRITATNDPVSVARFFKIVVDAFISQIVKVGSREGGIFGPCDAYFGTTEASGRGALHLHCLIWIAGNVGIRNLQERIASDDEFAASIIRYMEDVIKQSLNAVDEADLSGPPLLERTINPDSDEFEHDLENDSNLVARRFNMHKHTATCRKYRSGEQSC